LPSNQILIHSSFYLFFNHHYFFYHHFFLSFLVNKIIIIIKIKMVKIWVMTIMINNNCGRNAIWICVDDGMKHEICTR